MMYFNTDIIGGWAGDQLDGLKESISEGIYDGFVICIDTVCDFVFWGSKVGILCCAIIYIASKDQRSISLAIKLFLLYLVTAVVSGQI